MIPLRHSTANQHIALGYFLDSTDGNTEETAATISVLASGIRLWKWGLNTIATKNSGDATVVAGNIWKATFDGIDSNTLGPMQIFAHPTGALRKELDACVMPTTVFDALIASGAIMPADVRTWRGSTVNALIAGRVDVDLGNAQTAISASVSINSVIQADIVRINANATPAARLASAFDTAAGIVPELGIIDRGTAQSVGSNQIAVRAAFTPAASVLAGATIWILSSTNGQHERRLILNNAGSVLTVDPWTQTPSGTVEYIIYPTPPGPIAVPNIANVVQWGGQSVLTPLITGVPRVDVGHWRGSVVNALINGQMDSAASVSGNVTVSSILAGVITATALHATATSAIQSGLATTSQVASTLNASITQVRGSTINALISGRVDSNIGAAQTALQAVATSVASAAVASIQNGLGLASQQSTIESRIQSVMRADVARWLGTTPITPNIAGEPVVDLVHWRGSAVNELISGKVDAAASAGGTVTVSSILAGVITATALHATASSAIQQGLATSTQLASTLNAQVASTVNAVVSSTVNANVSKINNVTVSGAGTSGSPWGP